MKKIAVFVFINLVIISFSFSQETLLTIGSNDISSSEFKRIFLKNNNNTTILEKDINDYLNLFINFKLKVYEAEKLGYDTATSYVNEYEKYIFQLASPFFIDTALENKLLHEIYYRSKNEIRMSYILVIPQNGDTANARKRVMKIYNRIQNGEDFQKVAMETSDSKKKDRDKCDAWYNKAFMVPYIIENFAYNNKIGDVSKPIFTNNAYFIVKITDKRKAPKKIKVAHIYVRLPKNPTEADSLIAMKTLDSISNDLKILSFEEVAKKYSQDKRSSVKGGDIGWFSTGRLFRNFEKTAFSIKKIGDYAGPVRSPAGYHFVKLLDREEYGSFDEEKEDFSAALIKSKRYSKVEENIIEKLKKEYNFSQVEPLEKFYSEIDSSIFKAKWKADKFKNDNRVLATFADKKLSFEDFAIYLEKNQMNIYKNKFDKNISEKYSEYVITNIKTHKISQLKKNNSYFKNLSQEYHDGLLLFDITNDMVWTKAINDTLGLKKYYSENRNKYHQKLNLTIFSYSNEKSKKKTVKLLKKKNKMQLSDSIIVKNVNKKTQLITLEQNGVFNSGDNTSVDYVINLMKNNKIENNQNIVVDEKNKKIIYIKNNLSDIKGIVTADYQNILEKEWIKHLRKKYKIVINQDNFNNTKKELLNR